jgi:sulfur carrier protein
MTVGRSVKLDFPRSPMEIVLNGDARDVPEGCTLAGLLELLELDPSRVAVELDREIVKPPHWPVTILQPDSKVEIVMFVGGG